jgi:DeoR family transcriptional regulator, fructose operon transcriptional repressor
MESYKRRQAILTLLKHSGEVKIEKLARHFDVSENSIRNDLDAMAQEGLLTRVRGGAIAPATNKLLGKRFASRVNKQQREKESIGRWSASLVKDGDAIILDDSSSV